MRWFVIGGAGLIVMGRVLAACVGDSNNSQAGMLDQPCLPGNACDGTLTCVSNVCVQLDAGPEMDSGTMDSGTMDSGTMDSGPTCDAAPGALSDPCGGGQFLCLGAGDGGVCVTNPMDCMDAGGPPVQCTQSLQCMAADAGVCCASINVTGTMCPPMGMPAGMMGPPLSCSKVCPSGQYTVCTNDAQCTGGTTCHAVAVSKPPAPPLGICM